MRIITLILATLFSTALFAETARVMEVVPGSEPFAKLDNGEVRFLDNKAMLNVGDFVEVSEGGHDLKDSSYKASVTTAEGATAMFEKFRPTKWVSQCYNRAHVWAYEEFNRSGTNLNKMFLFFTNSFIRKYNYKWWFHVAPSTVVDKKDVVLDWTFFDKPELVSDWTAHFMKDSGRSCPMVTKFTDYENNQETEDCYLIKASMYFLQPLDLENFEQNGEEKTEFIQYEVNRAYRNAL